MEVLAPTHHQRADVVRLEEPFVRVDGDRVAELETPDTVGVARREPGRAAVRGIDMEPQSLLFADVRESWDVVDGSGVGGPCDSRDAERHETSRSVLRDLTDHRFGAKAEPVVARDHAQRGRG